MFIASYKNTMRNAKITPAVALVAPVAVKSSEELALERRRQRQAELQREAKELKLRQEKAKRELAAVASYRCIEVMKCRTPARDIIRLVADANGLKLADLLGDRRFRPIVDARFDAIKAVADARPDLSLPQIGKIFGKDHTTILHALRQRGGRLSSAEAAR